MDPDIRLEFYTLKPLPIEMRKDFKLYENPYKGKPSIEATGGIMDVLDGYDPIYYRTDRRSNSNGVILQPNGFDPTKESGYKSYWYVLKGRLTKNAIVPGVWTSGLTSKRFKDNYAWYLWGKEKVIISITLSAVNTIV